MQATTTEVFSSPRRPPFSWPEVIVRLRRAVRPFPKAMLFELRERGYASAFEQLVACLISIRTFDEVSRPAALALLEAARTPAAMARLSVDRIDRLIGRATFHRQKAERLREIARRVRDEHGGELPLDFATLVDLPGVGPKCANLALGIAGGHAAIGVDIHVHRVTNRWGLFRTRTPEATRAALEASLPRRYWIELNSLLVPFGKHICTGRRPKCSTCPLLRYCRQVGVTDPR